MPIKPENRHHYQGREWQEIRSAILARAGNRCEGCGVENHALGYRSERNPFGERDGRFVETPGMEAEVAAIDGHKVIQIVLTISHTDHDPTNNDPGNLKSLCQRCHNRHDIPHRQRNAAVTRRQKAGQMELPL